MSSQFFSPKIYSRTEKTITQVTHLFKYIRFLKRNSHFDKKDYKRLEIEFDSYRNTVKNYTHYTVKFWDTHRKSFPMMHSIAERVLSVPSSSAEVERSYSTHNLIMTNRRTNMDQENLRMIAFLKHKIILLQTLSGGLEKRTSKSKQTNKTQAKTR